MSMPVISATDDPPALRFTACVGVTMVLSSAPLIAS